MTSIAFSSLLEEVFSPAGLSADSARVAFDALFAGHWSLAQVAGFLAALRGRGESAEVITAAARAMRGAMIEVPHSFPKVLDTCGTGGDGKGTINLSTGAALIVAAAGIPVAKHGNRAVSSKAGSADVLAALGIPIELSAQHASKVLEGANIAFLLAPNHHPAMRHAMPARKELGVRTLFNCVGPLTNPANASHQVVGVFSDALRPMLAQTLSQLGTTAAWVVRGEDGLDEISPYGPTRVTELRNGKIQEFQVAPEDFGLQCSPDGAALGGSAQENAAIIEQVLSNEPHPATDAFVLNAAAALVVADDMPPKQAALRAREVLETKAALATLERWRSVSQALLQPPSLQ